MGDATYELFFIANKNYDKPEDCKICDNNLRFIRWYCRRTKIYCPNYLNINNVSEEEIKFIKLQSFIIRKINYKYSRAMKLIDKLKNYNECE